MITINVFIKSFQDLDHITPIISYLSKNKDIHIKLYSFNNELNNCEDHLRFLKDECKLDVEYLNNYFTNRISTL